MRSDRGQATIEVVALFPLCLLCALAVVEAGVLVQERLAVSQAAGRAAVAEVRHEDPTAAARGVLPKSLERGLRVSRSGSTITVSTPARVRLLGAAGVGRLSSSVRLGDEVAR